MTDMLGSKWLGSGQLKTITVDAIDQVSCIGGNPVTEARVSHACHDVA